MKRWEAAVVVAAVTAGLLVLLELALSLIMPDMPYELYRFDRRTGYILKPGARFTGLTGLFSPALCRGGAARYTASVDARGERAVPASAPGRPRTLMVLGDSCSFGWELSDHETFANLLAARAAREGIMLTVRLLAVPGYSSLEGYLGYLDRGGAPPDVAVVAFGANDEDPIHTWWRGGLTDYELHSFTSGRAGEVGAAVYLRMLFGGLRITRLAAQIPERGKPGDDAQRRMTPAQTAEVMDALVKHLRGQNVSVIVHNLCASSRDAQIRQAAAANGVTFVDTVTPFSREWRSRLPPDATARATKDAEARYGAACLAAVPSMHTTTDDFHPNALASQIIADTLWPQVAAALARRP